MNSFSELILLLFGFFTCVPSRDPAHYSSQLLRDNLTCSYNGKIINCAEVPYLLNYSNYKPNRQFGDQLPKSTYYVYPKNWLPRSTFPLKGRLDPPTKLYSIPLRVTQPYIINRNIGKNNINLFPFKHKNSDYDPSLSTTEKKDFTRCNDNLISDENDKADRTTNEEASEHLNEYTPKFNDKTFNVSHFFFDKFKKSLDLFDSKFYQVSFRKLIAISPENRKDNGISFVQSGLLLYLALSAISTEVDVGTKLEIDANLMYPSSVMDKIKLSKFVIDWMPVSNHNLKFRWASRLALEEGLQVSQGFVGGIANSSQLHVEQFNSTDTKDNVFHTLNHMVETDSGGAMRNTFTEDDFSEGFCSVLLTTLYIRARWRVAPTVLNGTHPFKDGTGPYDSVKMIKLNDMMGYAKLIDWNAEAIEIKYASPGLTLLILVPMGNSITNLVNHMKDKTPQDISNKMHNVRVSATLPIYTLRMTLLLPGKLQMMNISRLVDAKLDSHKKCGELRLSHAVQRLMFWAEAGRHAFKDDGIEWDEAPDVKVVADRPYLFYVRWKNVTLMNGNFVL